MNTVTIAGNLTRDPELRFLDGGAATAGFGIAVSRRWFDKTKNDWTEVTSFFDVVAWRTLADNVAETLKKGDRVVVTGRLEQRSWEKDGEKRSKVEIVADEIASSLKFANKGQNNSALVGGFSTDPF